MNQRRRLPAEWEPQTLIQFTFPHEDSDWAEYLDQVVPCFVEMIEAVCRFENVLVVCKEVETVKNLLAACPPEKLTLVEAPSNDTWARDHGGITIFEDGKKILLDFMFNGWGLKFASDKDNLLTERLFKKGILKAGRLEKPGLVLEGGAIESDSRGTLLTTSECMLSPNRNPHLSKKQLENRLKKIFGLDRVLWLDYGFLAGDDTDSHIDTLARFCDARTIAYVQCGNPKDIHYEALKRMEAQLKTFTDPEGIPYRLIPLPFPDACFDESGDRLPATYANFLILNGAVLVPVYNVPQDAAALKILRNVFPDRKIVSIDCRALILQHGSLHCATMQYY